MKKTKKLKKTNTSNKIKCVCCKTVFQLILSKVNILRRMKLKQRFALIFALIITLLLSKNSWRQLISERFLKNKPEYIVTDKKLGIHHELRINADHHHDRMINAIKPHAGHFSVNKVHKSHATKKPVGVVIDDHDGHFDKWANHLNDLSRGARQQQERDAMLAARKARLHAQFEAAKKEEEEGVPDPDGEHDIEIERVKNPAHADYVDSITDPPETTTTTRKVKTVKQELNEHDKQLEDDYANYDAGEAVAAPAVPEF